MVCRVKGSQISGHSAYTLRKVSQKASPGRRSSVGILRVKPPPLLNQQPSVTSALIYCRVKVIDSAGRSAADLPSERCLTG